MPLLNIRRLDWSPSPWRSPAPLLQGIDLQVRSGEFVGLIGPNGSGKSSLLGCAYRYARPTAGGVELHGRDIWRLSPRVSARHIAVVLQEFPQDFGLRAADVVAMGRTPHKGLFDGDDAQDAAIVAAALAQVGASALHAQVFATLSGGEKQRILLARALAQQPELLILDEPTNHLDPRYQLELLEQLRRLQHGVLASFHDLNLAAAFCDRLYVLAGGRLVANGTPAQVLTAELLLKVFGVQALVDTHPRADHPRITWITPR